MAPSARTVLTNASIGSNSRIGGREHINPIGLLKHVWSAARVQEELSWTRSSLRKCIRPLVENGLRAHDDDPRVPVLVNRRGHERPVFQRRFSGTPFDCFFVLPVLLQTSGKRTSKSLRLAGNCNGRHGVIVLSARQYRPTDPGQLVRRGHDYHIAGGSAFQALHPLSQIRSFAFGA